MTKMLSLICLALLFVPCTAFAQAIDRNQAVIDSYREAFGRDPADGERNYWVGRTDWTSKAALVEMHRTYLKSDANSQNTAVTSAYNRIWDRGPDTNELNTWLPSARSGTTSVEIERSIRSALPKNTHIKLVTTMLPGGLTLVRHFDRANTRSIEDVCGSVVYHTALIGQMRNQVSYYNSPDGSSNKFLKHVTLHVYDPGIAFPSTTDEAHCQDLGNRNSIINIKKFTDDYRYQGGLSHEMGHAYHNWTRCFSGAGYGPVFSAFFEKQVSQNGTTWSATGKPWFQPWAPRPGRNEDKVEQFANVYRYFKGTDATRGKSGPPSPDIVVPGFKDPAANRSWGKQLNLLPELTGYWDTHGLQPDSLTWEGGDDGYWQFKNRSNVFMKQSAPYEWYEYDGAKWNRVNPTYNVE